MTIVFNEPRKFELQAHMIARSARAIDAIDALDDQAMPAWERERQTRRIWNHQRRLAMRDATTISHLQPTSARSMHAAYRRRSK